MRGCALFPDVYKAMVDRMPLDSNLDDDLSGVLPVNIAKLALLYEDDPDPYFKGVSIHLLSFLWSIF